MKNILLTIEYDGTNFCGWQRQPGRRTVQGELERVLSVLCRQEITVAGTSRTDAGVHAYGQRVTLRGDFGIPADRVPIAANNLLSGTGSNTTGDIRILEAKEMPPGFHARFDAVGKKYIYKIRNAEKPDIMQRNYCYQIARALDPEPMREAARQLTGEHDFRTFMSAGGKVPESTVRTVYKAEIHDEPIEGGGRWIRFEITGSGFLYNMVRIIAGTLTEVGAGKIKPCDMSEIIDSLDRRRAGHTAPPQGLYLAEVYFDKNEFE